MANVSLTQAEADVLLKMEKLRTDLTNYTYPGVGGKISVPLISKNGQEQFILDIRRARASLKKTKGTYQNRGRRIFILARLDFFGAPHRNPDGEEIGTPHLHLYREGFGDKWAEKVPCEYFPNLHDPWLMLKDFMDYCNITEPPKISPGLFK